jgi:hypothetical protein
LKLLDRPSGATFTGGRVLCLKLVLWRLDHGTLRAAGCSACLAHTRQARSTNPLFGVRCWSLFDSCRI